MIDFFNFERSYKTDFIAVLRNGCVQKINTKHSPSVEFQTVFNLIAMRLGIRAAVRTMSLILFVVNMFAINVNMT